MNDLNLFKKTAARTRSGGLLALFLMAGLPAMVTPLRADNPPTYLLQWGSQGTGSGQFNSPGGIAIDNNNNVYLLDSGNSRVEKFDRNGNYLTQWGSPGYGNGQFVSADGIAVDNSNNVYVVDGSSRVEKFDGNGNYLTQWGGQGSGNGQFSTPEGIAVDNSNNVYVVDSGNSRVEKFDSNGIYLTQWGSYGTDNGQFVSADGIAVDGGNNVYVVDQDDSRIEKFDSNGNYLTQWGSQGTGNGQFEGSDEGADGIAVDSGNNVYVVDTSNSRIEKFDSNGNYLTQWGSQGYGNGEFEYLRAIALDGSGNFIYVADVVRVQVFASSVTQIPPYITSQPASQSVAAGVTVSLSVTTVGGEPMTYQWTSNDVALPDATNSALTLASVSPADTAIYDVLVTNSFGDAASSNIVLTVEPAFVNTLPATGVGAAGAVLNGSVTVGEDTIVWFNWGADTSYGNGTAMIIVPGASGTTNLNATLSGLGANTYHYQIVASNISGVVYGNDQSFVVADHAPTVTTLSPVGTTLHGMVNPNGLDTTVYFRWGVTGLTNLTPAADVGAGAAPLNVSSFITGLAPATQYHYEVGASNFLGTVFGASIAFFSPPFVGVPNQNWDSVASSADGRVLVAVANENNNTPPISTGGSIFISTNSGATWTEATGAPTNGLWETVACSADASKMVAAGGGGVPADFLFSIYTSSDMGATWVSNNMPVANWQSVASSADGTRLAAADFADRVIYTSTNSGATWTQAANAPKEFWYSIALSADGTKLAAVANGSFSGGGGTNIYTSNDFGVTWIANAAPKTPNTTVSQKNWVSIASSADGNKLIAAGGGPNGSSSGYIFISTNSGATWTLTATNIVPAGLNAHPWLYVASSADGSKLAAVSDGTGLLSGVFISTNSGATWTNAVKIIPPLTWNAVAFSADGAKLVATVGYPSTGPIYVSQTTPSPMLDLSASDNGATISWLIPSLDFALQQSSDLLNWTDVTNPPVLNLTNLQNQVVLPPTDGNSFFRLMH